MATSGIDSVKSCLVPKLSKVVEVDGLFVSMRKSVRAIPLSVHWLVSHGS